MSGPALRSLLWPAIASLTGIAALAALGVWQLERLAWKEAIIARIDARVKAPPIAVPGEADWPRLIREAYDYRHVSVTGSFEHGKEALVFRNLEISRVNEGGPGFLVLTPLRLEGGAAVIVNRGFVPQARSDPAKRAAGQIAGPVTITGLMRPPETRNLFTPADDPAKGLWFTRDPAAIAAHFKLARAAPFTIDADAAPGAGSGPQGGVTVLAIPNSHLSYALTWFALALTLAAVFAAFALKRLRA